MEELSFEIQQWFREGVRVGQHREDLKSAPSSDTHHSLHVWAMTLVWTVSFLWSVTVTLARTVRFLWRTRERLGLLTNKDGSAQELMPISLESSSEGRSPEPAADSVSNDGAQLLELEEDEEEDKVVASRAYDIFLSRIVSELAASIERLRSDVKRLRPIRDHLNAVDLSYQNESHGRAELSGVVYQPCFCCNDVTLLFDFASIRPIPLAAVHAGEVGVSVSGIPVSTNYQMKFTFKDHGCEERVDAVLLYASGYRVFGSLRGLDDEDWSVLRSIRNDMSEDEYCFFIENGTLGRHVQFIAETFSPGADMPELSHSIDLVTDRCCRGDDFEEKLREFDRVQRTIIETSCSPDYSRLMKRNCGLNLELERLESIADRLCEVEIFNSSDEYNLCYCVDITEGEVCMSNKRWDILVDNDDPFPVSEVPLVTLSVAGVRARVVAHHVFIREKSIMAILFFDNDSVVYCAICDDGDGIDEEDLEGVRADLNASLRDAAEAERFDHLSCYYISINLPLAIPVGVLNTLADVGVHRERLEEVMRELESDA